MDIVIYVLPFLIIAVVFYSIYLYKISKAKQLLSEAEEAEKDGNFASTVILLKQALWKANEKPEMEITYY